MSWRDGCAARPTVHADASPVAFDFDAADAVGQRLDGLRLEIEENLAARADAQVRLVDWAGGHRQEYDEHRSAQEAVLAGSGIPADLARLRAAWDEAAAAQIQRNTVAEQAAEQAAAEQVAAEQAASTGGGGGGAPQAE